MTATRSMGRPSREVHPVVVDGPAGVLPGVCVRPAEPGSPSLGVLLLGAPGQTRAGPRRAWVRLAEACVDHGVAMLRIDARGEGDAGGERTAPDAWWPDVVAGLDALRGLVGDDVPLGVVAPREVAAAAVLALPHAARAGVPVQRLALIEPWSPLADGAPEEDRRGPLARLLAAALGVRPGAMRPSPVSEAMTAALRAWGGRPILAGSPGGLEAWRRWLRHDRRLTRDWSMPTVVIEWPDSAREGPGALGWAAQAERIAERLGR